MATTDAWAGTRLRGHDLSASLFLLRVNGELGELKTGTGILEREDGEFEKLSLHLELFTEAIDELESEVTVGNRPADGGKVIGNRLKLAGIVGDGEIATGRVAERLAQKEVARVLVVDEEARDTRPG